MEYAKQVQTRLFPQKLTMMRCLEYAGGCIQACQVGGDYYDLLELGPGHLGLVLADIAGKGIAGALLMANLRPICAVSTRLPWMICRACSNPSINYSTKKAATAAMLGFCR